MTFAEFKRCVLELSIEDWEQLYNIFATYVNRFPNESPERQWSGAHAAVSDLFDREFIGIWHGGPRDSGNPVAVESKSEAAHLLADRENWELPSDASETYYVASTPKGEAFYYSGANLE